MADQWRLEVSVAFSDDQAPVERLIEDGVEYTDLVPTTLNAWLYRTQNSRCTRVNLTAISPSAEDGRTFVIMYDSEITERKGDWYRPIGEIPLDMVDLVQSITGVDLLDND